MAWSIFSDGGGQEVAKGWAEQLLRSIGAPVTAGNVQFVYDWEVSEGGGGKYNPLNQGPVPGKPNLTTTGQQYGGGAADFASWQAGLQGATDYLNMPAYQGIRDNLKKNNPAAARAALISSGWAASHYGGGSAFSDAAVPGGKAVLPPVGAGSGDPSGASGSSCVIALPSLGPIGGGCLFSKSQARAVIGGLMVGGGSVIMIAGVAVLLVSAFGRSKIATAAGAVPGVGTVGQAAQKLNRNKPKPKSAAKSKPAAKPAPAADQ